VKLVKAFKNKILIYVVSVVSFFQLAMDQVFSANFGDAPSRLKTAGRAAGGGQAPASNPGAIVGQGIKIVLQMVGLMFLVLTVYAGVLWMTSRGDDDQISKARDTLVTAAIGLFIVMSAYSITFLVTGSL
jgi:hypothetical protein